MIWTDGTVDRRTDTPSYIDAWMRVILTVSRDQGGTLCQCIGPPSRYFAICDCTIPKANIKNIMMLALLLSRAATFYPNPKSAFVAFIAILAICLCTLVTQPKSIKISIVYIPLERYFIRLQF